MLEDHGVDEFVDVIDLLWGVTGTEDRRTAGVLDALTVTGPRAVLPAAFDVTGLATGAVAVATLAAAQLIAVRRGTHDRETVRAAVACQRAEDLESAIVEAGGAAAVMHERDRRLAMPAGAASAGAPPVSVTERRSAPITLSAPADRALDGVRVLDLTRVIAGPVATKFLAGYGADVLRVDPSGFEEVGSLLPETTLGKRTTFLDLTAPADRVTFEELLAGADVLVSGLRADALARLGYDDQTVTALNPNLIHANLDAYGWRGPWRNRRGFDSLVQMSCGIAAHGAAAAGRDEPTPLPVQALDHATGWLLAAAIARTLTRRLTDSTSGRIHACLIGTANLLYSLNPPAERPSREVLDEVALDDTTTAWGSARRVPLPGRIDGIHPFWSAQAGPLGRYAAGWNAR